MHNPFKDQTECDCHSLIEDTKKRQEFYIRTIMAAINDLDAKLDTYIAKIQALEAKVAEQQAELTNPPLPDSTNQKLATLDTLTAQ